MPCIMILCHSVINSLTRYRFSRSRGITNPMREVWKYHCTSRFMHFWLLWVPRKATTAAIKPRGKRYFLINTKFLEFLFVKFWSSAMTESSNQHAWHFSWWGTLQSLPGEEEGGGGGVWGGVEKWVKYAPKLSHTTPLIKQKLISTPSSHNDNIKTTPPPSLKEVSSHWFPYN